MRANINENLAPGLGPFVPDALKQKPASGTSITEPGGAVMCAGQTELSTPFGRSGRISRAATPGMRIVSLFLLVLGLALTCRPCDAQRLSDERVVFQTTKGDIELAFYPDVAPVTSAHISISAGEGCTSVTTSSGSIRVSLRKWTVWWEVGGFPWTRTSARLRRRSSPASSATTLNTLLAPSPWGRL